MAPQFWSLLLLVLSFGAQQAAQPLQETNVLTPAEQAQLSKATKIDGRIKVYQTASERFRASVAGAVAKHDFPSIPGPLRLWGQLLIASEKDIDASITNRKKKSGALIKYEIQLRRSITEIQKFKTSVSVDVYDEFDVWLKQAEAVHQQFVDILFPK